MPSISITNLPLEILTNIIDYLQYDQCTLAQLSSSSGLFNRLATPLLYCCYAPGPTHKSHTRSGFYAFLRTILTNPRLASYVKHVRLWTLEEDFDHHQGASKGYLFNLQQSTIMSKCFRWFRLYAGADACEKWLSALQADQQSATDLLLLCSLPNLETIIFPEHYYSTAIWKDFVEYAVIALKFDTVLTNTTIHIPFSKLRTVRTWTNESLHHSMENRLAFFELPSMRDLDISTSHWSPQSPQQRFTKLGPKQPYFIKRLVIQGCAISVADVCATIRECVGLEHFHFTHYYGTSFKSQRLIHELVRHASTLEALRIDLVDQDDRTADTVWDDEHNASLSPVRTFAKRLLKLDKLKFLGLSQSLLHAEDQQPRFSEYLPRQLEKFEIYTCDWTGLAQLRVLADHQRKFKPLEHLKTVRIDTILQELSSKAFLDLRMPEVEIECILKMPPVSQLNGFTDCCDSGISETNPIFSNHPLMEYSCSVKDGTPVPQFGGERGRGRGRGRGLYRGRGGRWAANDAGFRWIRHRDE